MGVIKWKDGYDPNDKNKQEDESELKNTPLNHSTGLFKKLERILEGKALPQRGMTTDARIILAQMYQQFGEAKFIDLMAMAIASSLEAHRIQVVTALTTVEGIEDKRSRESVEKLKTNYNKLVESVKKVLINRINSLLI